MLTDYSPEPVRLSLLFLPGRARLKRVRALVDALDDALRHLPGIAPST
ncbi:hypothetical protein [Sphingomonas oryzagri]